MDERKKAGAEGSLFVVATPLGNLGDITLRALEVLRAVDLIAAEDTRNSRKLLAHHGIHTPMESLHDYNERERAERLLQRVEQGQDIALISDAGTPLISDPGYVLIREARRRGMRVSPIPGPTALICALSAAGLPSDRFVFEGFAPRNASQRRKWLAGLTDEPRTLVYYESSHRILESLRDARDVLGAEREAVVARELTKLHETFLAGTLSELVTVTECDQAQRKGELVVLVAGKEEGASGPDEADAERVLAILIAELPLKQAALLASRITGVSKNALYEKGLRAKGAHTNPP